MNFAMSTNNKTYLITGVSRGLGYGLALACLERGDTVLGLGRSSATDLVEHPRFRFSKADVTDADACDAALGNLLGDSDQLDCVILNAGILGKIADMPDQSLEMMKGVMEVNVWANKVLLDLLLGRDLRIAQVVAISSGASVNGSRGWGGYSLSKAALNMLVKLYAKEHEEIHFSALAPGLIDTGMQDQIRAMPESPLFPSVAKLKQASGTDAMPNPATAGRQILEAIERLTGLVASGEFADIRSLPAR